MITHKKFAATVGRINEYRGIIARLNDTDIDSIFAEYGKRYVKISVGRTVHTFVDFENGDILKAASWRAPAINGVRGNIWEDDRGESVINQYGANYLK